MTTKDQIKGVLEIVKAFADTIREAKQIPAGHLYATVMGQMSLEQFEKIIGVLVNAGLVKRHQSHLLEWIETK